MPDITSRLTLDAGAFFSTLKAAARQADSFGSGLGGATGRVSSLASSMAKYGAIAVSALAAATAAVLAHVDGLDLMAAQTDINTDKLQEWQATLGPSDVSLQSFTESIIKLGKVMAGEDQPEKFKDSLDKLGVSLAALSKMTPEEQFITLVSAAQKLARQTGSSAGAVSLLNNVTRGFGTTVAGLVRDQVDLNQVSQTYRRLMGRPIDAGGFDRVGDALGTIKNQLFQVTAALLGMKGSGSNANALGGALEGLSATLGKVINKLDEWQPMIRMLVKDVAILAGSMIGLGVAARVVMSLFAAFVALRTAIAAASASAAVLRTVMTVGMIRAQGLGSGITELAYCSNYLRSTFSTLGTAIARFPILGGLASRVFKSLGINSINSSKAFVKAASSITKAIPAQSLFDIKGFKPSANPMDLGLASLNPIKRQLISLRGWARIPIEWFVVKPISALFGAANAIKVGVSFAFEKSWSAVKRFLMNETVVISTQIVAGQIVNTTATSSAFIGIGAMMMKFLKSPITIIAALWKGLVALFTGSLAIPGVNVVTGAIAALIAVIAVLWSNWDTLMQALKDSAGLKYLKAQLANLNTVLKRTFGEDYASKLMAAFKWLWEWAKKIVSALAVEGVVLAWNVLAWVIGTIVRMITNLIIGAQVLWDILMAIPDAVSKKWQELKDQLGGVWDMIKDVLGLGGDVNVNATQIPSTSIPATQIPTVTPAQAAAPAQAQAAQAGNAELVAQLKLLNDTNSKQLKKQDDLNQNLCRPQKLAHAGAF